jgi:Tol biopolymer transport system component
MNADGSQRTRLTKSEDKLFALAPAWSLDGKRIAYSTMQEPGPGSAPQTAIYLIDADGKNSKKLGEGLLPVWSPDGKKIAYSLFKDKGDIPSLYIMDADGSNAKMLAEKGVGSCWSPDGKRLLYMSEGGDNQADIFVMNADGSQPTQLTKTPDAMEFGTLWSADGKRIFFTRFPKEKPNGLPKMQVYVMDADGSNVKSLTSGDAANFLGTGTGLFVVLSQVAHGE